MFEARDIGEDVSLEVLVLGLGCCGRSGDQGRRLVRS